MSVSTSTISGSNQTSLSPTREAIRTLRKNPVAIICAIYIVVLLFVAVFANFVAPYDYSGLDSSLINVPSPPSGQHLLGADHLGRDVLSRLIYGARISLSVSLVVVVIEVLVGVTLGLFAGYRGGRTDILLMSEYIQNPLQNPPNASNTLFRKNSAEPETQSTSRKFVRSRRGSG